MQQTEPNPLTPDRVPKGSARLRGLVRLTKTRQTPTPENIQTPRKPLTPAPCPRRRLSRRLRGGRVSGLVRQGAVPSKLRGRSLSDFDRLSMTLPVEILLYFCGVAFGRVHGLSTCGLKRYLARKKHPPPYDHHRSLGIGLL